MATPRILVVDDQPDLRDLVCTVLERAGMNTLPAEDGESGLKVLYADRPDLVVLDVTMPSPDGLGVLREMRTRGDSTPVLMLTARATVPDRVDGLEAGADDYLVKPFAVEELLARVRALLRRAAGGGEGTVLKHTDLVLDPLTREVRRGERMLELSPTEFALLEMFLLHPRQVLTRSALYSAVWGYDFGGSSKSLEVYVGYLRRKTEDGGAPRLLHTVRGVGYVLREP